MREPRMTINGWMLSEPQARAVRVAIVAFLSELQNKQVSDALGLLGVDYHMNLSEVMVMIDESPAELSPPDEDLVMKSLKFIHQLMSKGR